MAQSVEPQIADLALGWLKQYKLKYYIEQDAPNDSIKNALHEYESKQGGKGGNRPDCNLLLTDSRSDDWPILIEFKGYKDRLVKLDSEGQVSNRNAKGEPDYKTISQYAVNGAVHYANALLHYTTYENIIAIGITGYIDQATNELRHELGVYYVGKSNLGVGQLVDNNYTDLSFLAPKHFDTFINKVRELKLTPHELEIIKQRREQEINASLVKLNNEIFADEKGLSEENRIYLVAATIIATLGIPNKVKPIEKKDLTSSQERGKRDGFSLAFLLYDRDDLLLDLHRKECEHIGCDALRKDPEHLDLFLVRHLFKCRCDIGFIPLNKFLSETGILLFLNNFFPYCY